MRAQKHSFLDIFSFWLFCLKEEEMGPAVEPSIMGYSSTVEVAIDGISYAAYEGIPYAKPPLGVLRFKNPEPFQFAPSRNLEYKVDCMHFDQIEDTVVGQEDCLYLNVYTPVPFDREKRPVLVWIHGSGFKHGISRSSIFGPERLLQHNIVVVTVSYRIGPLGFASTEEPSFPGNYGFMDQKMAVEWVLKYIHLFGGNPKDVTLAGHSAGAVDVLHHLHGDLSGNVTKGIAMSGSRFSPWSLSTLGSVRSRTLSLVKSLKCPVSPVDEKTLTCLRSVPAKVLTLQAHKKHYEEFSFKKYEPEDFVLYDLVLAPYRTVLDDTKQIYDPWTHKQDRNFTLLLTLNKEEASFVFADIPKNVKEKLLVHNKTFMDYFNEMKSVGGSMDGHDAFIDGYTKSKDLYTGVIHLMTDAWFVYPAVLESKFHQGDFYAIMFDLESNLHHWGCKLPKYGLNVGHGDELPFIFFIEACDTGKPDYDEVASKLSNMIRSYVSIKRFMAQVNFGLEMFEITKYLKNNTMLSDLDAVMGERMSHWMHIEPAKTHIVHNDHEN